MSSSKISLSEHWVERSLKAVWHPCTQMKHHERFPLIALSHAKGSWLYDQDGKRYLDAVSSWWVNLFGHANPKINTALKNQLDQLEHAMLAGFTHPPVVELSERLCALTNYQLGHVFYASDGASAIEIALKMSFHYWRNLGKTDKKEFICLKNSYHGETLGALAVTDVAIFKDAYGPLIGQAHIVMSPDARDAKDGESAHDVATRALQDLEKTLQQHSGKIAAMIIEPLIQCATGMAMYDASYLAGARRVCDQYGVHLIADEIAVGCGRTGSFFAMEQANVWPDFLALSKGISGGYLPLSLVMTTDKIYQAFYDEDVTRGFLHSHSYTGNVLACTAALATLDIFRDDDIIEKNKELAQSIKKSFAWAGSHDQIEHLRQTGMILAFDVKASAAPKDFAKEFFKTALSKELLVRPIGRTVYIMPPYTLSQEELTSLSQGIQETLHHVCQS
ncbi:MAG: adenosylmethionine--8-amino-7-oxononanoate transaminase [Polynucleobacter sp.]|nr:MAG: adenosylmethionine--8-amino-7-oxononanoate transaminase [Polynucleobacter sp.]